MNWNFIRRFSTNATLHKIDIKHLSDEQSPYYLSKFPIEIQDYFKQHGYFWNNNTLICSSRVNPGEISSKDHGIVVTLSLKNNLVIHKIVFHTI